MDHLSSYYDFKFDQLIVRYRSFKQHSDGDFVKLDSESCLSLGRPGAILVLGKNGSGKSRFLSGMKSFGERQMASSPVFTPLANPTISLRYSVPTIGEHLEYSEARKNILLNDKNISNFDDFYALQSYKNEKLNLHFHDLVIQSICRRLVENTYLSNFGFGLVQALRHFEFAELEIDAFENRMKDHLFEFGPYNPGQAELERPRENLNFRDYFAEFFLALLSNSYVHNVTHAIGPGTFFDCRDFLANKRERVRLVAALRDLFENATHIEVLCGGGEAEFSFVNQNSHGQDLDEILHLFTEFRDKYENPSFPFDLLRVGTTAATKSMKLETGFSRSYWEPFDILDLTFQKHEESLKQLTYLFSSFLTLKFNQDQLPDYEVQVSGLRSLEGVLDQVNRLLSEVDIGISRIQLQEPEHWFNLAGQSYVVRPISRDHDFTPIVGWQDASSNNWFPLEICSSGQLDVLRVLINLCHFTSSTSLASVKFLLIDEFDRHLHPVVAQQLLNLLDRFAKKFNTYALLSTHTISSLEVHRHTQVFASRDVMGFHHLSTNRIDDPKVVSVQLGVSERDTRKFVKLFVVVEGNHEEIIFNELFLSSLYKFDYEIINLNGLKGLQAVWRSQLQYESAEVLIVYDKRSHQLEEIWSKIQERRIKEKLVENSSELSEINQLQREAWNRIKNYKHNQGDTELNALCFLLKEVLESNDNQAQKIRRLHLHGVEVADIVDCLPTGEFLAARSFDSWEKIRQQHNELKPTEFKKRFSINDSTVEKAVKGKLSQDSIHPELQRLWSRILNLLEMRSDWLIN